VPAVENVAVVLRAPGFAKVTVPGPLAMFQVPVRAQFGRQGSVTLPERAALEGSVIVRFAPALTTGPVAAFTVTVVVLLDESWPSLAVSCRV